LAAEDGTLKVLEDYRAFERRLDRTNLIVVLLAVALVAFLDSPRGGASIGAGGLISYVNFRWLKRAVNFVILEGGEGPVGRRVGLQYAGRYALIGIALFVTIRFTLLDLTLLLAGLFSYVLAVFLECLFEISSSLLRRDPNGRT
jgi:hypothetical protein